MKDESLLFWTIGIALLGVAWAFSRLIPEYLLEQWHLQEPSADPMQVRFAAARGAFHSVFGDDRSSPPARRRILFFSFGAALLISDYIVAGPSALGFAAQVFLLAQLVLATVCQEHGILPDVVTLPLAAVGLLLGASGHLLTPAAVIWGLLVGGGVPLVFSMLFMIFHGREGISEGVLKHAAAVGAWVGPAGSLIVLTLACLIGPPAQWVKIKMFKGSDLQENVNFGPTYAAVAALFFLVAQKPPNALLLVSNGLLDALHLN